MKLGTFILGVLAGGIAAHIWHKKDWAKNKAATLTPEETGKVVVDVIKEESVNFSDALKRDFDVIMPSDVISKKVAAKAKQFTEGRYAVDLTKAKSPYYI